MSREKKARQATASSTGKRQTDKENEQNYKSYVMDDDNMIIPAMSIDDFEVDESDFSDAFDINVYAEAHPEEFEISDAMLEELEELETSYDDWPVEDFGDVDDFSDYDDADSIEFCIDLDALTERLTERERRIENALADAKALLKGGDMS